MSRHPVSSGSAFLLLSLAACAGGAVPGERTITEAALSADLHALAHDSMAGRLVGTPEVARAADWIAARFDSLGLKPAGANGTWFQPFDLTWRALGEPNRLAIAGEGRTRAPGEGWTPMGVSGSGAGSGEVVFAGYGIVAPAAGWDDYRGADVRGKIVLILEREPGVGDPASPFDGVVTSEAAREWRKVMSAQERGAAGVLFVRDIQARPDIGNWAEYHATTWPPERRRIERWAIAAWADQVRIPVAQVSAEVGERLAAGSGRGLEALAREAEQAAGGLGVIPLGRARISLAVTVVRNVTPARNILAMVEGADSSLRNEYVIVGAHHDHNGADSAVYNGADDDGSGTVGVMAVARAYAEALRGGRGGERPRRSVIFAIWDAEERGLLGSWYYTTAPVFPLERTVANLNLDMIGRHEEVPPDGGGRFNGLEPQTAESNANAVNIVGSTFAPDVGAALEAANSGPRLTLRYRYDNNESNLLRRSDHWPFLQRGVPAVWVHTGLHPDYHTHRDDPDRIEYGKMTRIVRLVHRASWDLANRDGRPGPVVRGPRPRS